MLHVRNSSLGGIFFLENDGVPTSLVSYFDEPIIEGSLCVDRLNGRLYILRNQVWVINGSDTPTSGNIINSNYDDMLLDANSSGLIEGALYKFDYTNTHLIPGTNVLNINSPNYIVKIETFLAKATSSSTFDKNVFSVNHPLDIIEYDLFDNIAEDTITNRTGKVYRRIDTVLRRETPYDHRATYFRRTKLDQASYPQYGTSSVVTFAIDYVEGSSFYKADEDILYTSVRDISDKENLEFNPYLSRKTFPNYNSFASYTDFDNSETYDASLNVDVLTFESDSITDILIEKNELFGVNNYYNDIVFFGSCSDIKLNGFVRSSTFENSKNIEINKGG
jgi:hypothetical protein